MSDEGPRDLGVDEAVTHDEDVEQRLPQGSSILHLPAGPAQLRFERQLSVHKLFPNMWGAQNQSRQRQKLPSA